MLCTCFPAALGPWPKMYIFPAGGILWTWLDLVHSIYNYFKLTSFFILPLLHLLFVVHRYTVIYCPNLITKFFTTTKCVLAVIGIFLFGALISIHELFYNTQVSINGILFFSEKRQHEKYTSTYIPLLLLVKGVIIVVALIFFTKKMNTALSENIHFLREQDAVRHELRIKSYLNIIRFNLTVVFLCIISISINLTKQVASDLSYYIVNQDFSDYEVITALGIDLISVVSAFEFFLFPLSILLFLPHMKELKSRLCCCCGIDVRGPA